MGIRILNWGTVKENQPVQRSLSEMLEMVSKKKTTKEKIAELQYWGGKEMRYILKLTYDPGARFALPGGDPPYTPSEVLDNHGMLFQELRRLYLFLDPSCGGNAKLKQARREQLFLQLLESVTPGDAKLLIGMMNKSLPWKSIDAKLVKQAFPDLW
jgi:hypothetical protein